MKRLLLVGDPHTGVEILVEPLAERFSVSGPRLAHELGGQAEVDVAVVWTANDADIGAVRRFHPMARVLVISPDPTFERAALDAGADVVIPVEDATPDYVAALATPGLSAVAAGVNSQIELTATFTADAVGNLTRSSPFFAELMVAESNRKLTGKALPSLFAREGQGESVLARLVPGSTVRNVEVEIIRLDGTRGWVLMTLRRTKDGSKIHGAAVDITEVAQAWQSLARSEARYRSLFDASPLPIWEIDLLPAVNLLHRLRIQEPDAPRLQLAALVVGSMRLVHANDPARKRSLTSPSDDAAVLRALVRMAGGPSGMDLLDQVERFAATAGPMSVVTSGRDTSGQTRRVSVTWNAPSSNATRDLGRTTVSIAPVDLWA